MQNFIELIAAAHELSCCERNKKLVTGRILSSLPWTSDSNKHFPPDIMLLLRYKTTGLPICDINHIQLLTLTRL